MPITLFSANVGPAALFFPQRNNAVFARPASLFTPGDRVDIRFGATAHTGFSPQAMETIQSTLGQCHYAQNLDHLLRPESGFKVLNMWDKVVLSNYHSPSALEPPFKGVCDDLALQAGRFLEKKLGDDFVIKVGEGPCDQYFKEGSHVYLLVWPRSRDTEVKTALAQNKTALPEACLLVDPSFNHVARDLKGYGLTYMMELQQLERGSDDQGLVLPKDSVKCIVPMGLIKNVMPEKAHKYGPEAMLHLTFMMMGQGQPPMIFPAVQATADSVEIEPDFGLLADLPQTHPFQQFFLRVMSDLNQPTP